MGLQLPLEILIEVIDLCSKSSTRGQLASLCLVNKTFKEFAQSALYRKPGRLSSKKYAAFARAVSSNLALGFLVRELHWVMEREKSQEVDTGEVSSFERNKHGSRLMLCFISQVVTVASVKRLGARPE